MSFYLGLEVTVNDNGLMFNQRNYIVQLLKRFKFENCKSVRVPIETTKYEQTSDSEKIVLNYREAVGCLIYLATIWRPDIAFSVNFASRFVESPTSAHYSLVKRIFKYLQGTVDNVIFYRRTDNLDLVCYSDSDFAGDEVSRKSTSGYLLEFGSCVISWTSQKQRIVALSTTEAEYIAATEAIKEVIWCKGLLRDLGLNVGSFLCLDNQSSIKIIKNPELHGRTKHIDIKFHFIRDLYMKKEFELI